MLQDWQSYWWSLLSVLRAGAVDRCLEDFLSLDQCFVCSKLFKTQTGCWQEWNLLRTGMSKQKYIFKKTSVKKTCVCVVYSKMYLNGWDFLLLTPWTLTWNDILQYLQQFSCLNVSRVFWVLASCSADGWIGHVSKVFRVLANNIIWDYLVKCTVVSCSVILQMPWAILLNRMVEGAFSEK